MVSDADRELTETGRAATPDPSTSLVSRIAASTAVLAASLIVIAIVFFIALHWSFFQGTLDATLRGYSLSIAERLWQHPELAQKIAETHAIGIVVRTPERQLAFDPEGEAMPPDGPVTKSSRYWRIDATGPDGQKVSFYWDRWSFAKGHLPLLVSLIVFLLVMVGITYLFQLQQLRPLRWLRTGAEAVAGGDLKTRVPVVRHDEIGQAAAAFNQMTDRIGRMLSDRERLLADVSHELRSPLARIKVALELLPEGVRRDAIAKDVREMEALTAVLLERERIRTKTDRAERRPFDLAAVVRDAVLTFSASSPTVVVPEGELKVAGDPELVRVLVQNLVDNAIKFSLPDSGPARVEVCRRDGYAEILVSDEGRGIAEADRERVFEPFVKLDQARGHHTGYGLGLNLCQRIAEAHGGSIEIRDNRPRGTLVTVRLPVS